MEKSSKRLRHALDINEMKQQELADKSGVSKNSISQYLNKRSIPSNISAGKVENGEIAAVAIDDEATLKRFYRDGSTGTITLVAENPAYAPMVFTKESQKMFAYLEKRLRSRVM